MAKLPQQRLLDDYQVPAGCRDELLDETASRARTPLR
jgi:hypothetical protein